MGSLPPRVKTAYLGQYTDDHADEIGKQLDASSIAWWAKRSGRIVRVIFAGDWGVRMFAEASRLDEARAIAERVLGEPPAGGS